RDLWRGDLCELFDIASADVMNAKISDEDKVFLKMQREDHDSCSIGGQDKLFAAASERKRIAEEKVTLRKRRSQQQIDELFMTHFENTDSDDSA
ncbi:MAG: hypothetical protein AAGK05_15660, partial [Pseudomonadota bacterium]